MLTYRIRPLYEDNCLFVVPGSHKTPRTPEQRVHSSTMSPPVNPLDMPGAVCVKLKRKYTQGRNLSETLNTHGELR